MRALRAKRDPPTHFHFDADGVFVNQLYDSLVHDAEKAALFLADRPRCAGHFATFVVRITRSRCFRAASHAPMISSDSPPRRILADHERFTERGPRPLAPAHKSDTMRA
jgi:hypothetical protein